jgi:hypothetical protein
MEARWETGGPSPFGSWAMSAAAMAAMFA